MSQVKLSEIISSNNSHELLLEQIAKLQSNGDQYCSSGIFPSERYHQYLPYSRKDDNVFFTASIIYILNTYKNIFSKSHQQLIKEVSDKAISSYKYYQNTDGQKIYNFWRTLPQHNYLPNEKFLEGKRGKKIYRMLFKLAEDIDDTALVYLSSEYSKDDIEFIQKRLVYYANKSHRTVKSTLPELRNFKAYSTWFGQLTTPVEFDVCAMSNMLILLNENKSDFTTQDLETINLLYYLLDNTKLLDDSHILSPFYIKKEIVIYHLIRFLYHFDKNELERRKDSLQQLIYNSLSRRDDSYTKILLSTSLLRLGCDPLIIKNTDFDDKHFFDNWYCVANISSFQNKLSGILGKYSFFHIKFRCKAHTLVLLLEHEILKRNQVDSLK